MALRPGTKLGPYEIQSPLGTGGMGEVYRGRDTRLGRDVAIKVLPQALANDKDRLRRFEQEAGTIAALNHCSDPWWRRRRTRRKTVYSAECARASASF